MAAKNSNKTEVEKTKIRFIMLEAEGDASDLQQIAQAITNAVRPSFVQVAPASTTTSVNRIASQKNIELPDNTLPFMQDDELEAVEPQSVPKRPPSGSTKKRTLPTPSVIDDLDLNNAEIPFKKYHQDKNPTNHNKRYLVIAAWLKHYRQIDEIGTDHIYTCYRTIGLNVVPDVGGPFRSCKSQGWFSPGSQRGLYAINHVGLNEVNSLSN